MTEDLREDWLRLCATLGIAEAAGHRAFDRLAEAYGSSGRAYHTLDHIREVLRTLSSLTDVSTVLLAAWFHDAICDSRARDNEERSADFAEEILKDLGFPAETTAEVRRLILLTKAHDPADADAAGGALVDADLAILGAEPDAYQEYAAAIRKEYAWVPEDAYRAGRRAVLENFLKRPRIYRSEQLVLREAAARRNLAKEIESLRPALQSR